MCVPGGDVYVGVYMSMFTSMGVWCKPISVRLFVVVGSLSYVSGLLSLSLSLSHISLLFSVLFSSTSSDK